MHYVKQNSWYITLPNISFIKPRDVVFIFAPTLDVQAIYTLISISLSSVCGLQPKNFLTPKAQQTKQIRLC